MDLRESREGPSGDQDRDIRLEAIGQLAGGLAHDFNNLLTIILGYCNALDDQFDDADPRRGDIEQIRIAGERASRLTRQLLAFSGRQVLQPVVLDVGEFASRIRNKLASLLGDHVELSVTSAPEARPINADPAQLELVLMNLAVNARDAMPQGGRCSIAIANVEIGAGANHKHLALEPGSYVQISVADTGVGIEPALQLRIFEPFATMKPRGKGPGLGLATAYGIIRQSGGSISVQSEAGRGATFTIYLPAVQDEASIRVLRRAGETPNGEETVIVVEPEAGIRVLAQTVLKRAGYTVLAVATPADAIRIASDPDQRIDLLLTDAVMTDMDGGALLERLREVRPALRGLLMSGLPADVLAKGGPVPPNAQVLQKPFTASDLAWRVREVLDESGPSANPSSRGAR